MARQRFQAPAREAVPEQQFGHPIYQPWRSYRDWLESETWPLVGRLNDALGSAVHPWTGRALRFVAQTPELLADGLHYEARIHSAGSIATREQNWHDLFNALIWLHHRDIKAAMNERQVADLGCIGAAQRTRGQCALTHFDEAGAIVVLRDPAMLACWDSHDWVGLFQRHRNAWLSGAASVVIIGHALLERALMPDLLLTAKCIAVMASEPDDPASLESGLASAIVRGALLNDPQELRPLPLSGLPGWHPEADSECFLRSAECFRPLRIGREYPEPQTAGTLLSAAA